MTGARFLLARVRRLEIARAPKLSPYEAMPGGLDGLEAKCRAGIEAGELCGRDVPLVLMSIRRWHKDGVFIR